MTQKVVELGETLSLERLFGVGERHLRRVREEFGVRLVARGNQLKIIGSERDTREAHELLSRIVRRLEQDATAGPGAIDLLLEEECLASGGRRSRAARGAGTVGASKGFASISTLGAAEPGQPESSSALLPSVPSAPSAPSAPSGPPSQSWATRFKTRRSFEPKTAGQKKYLEAITANDIVFSIGPAGTGKTYLGVAMALEALRSGAVRRIILARPAVEAGEKLGFLPGDYHAKVNPYLRPLYDALNALLEYEHVRRLIDTEVVEVAPLAYMRGRTLDEAFIILDEAQNTTSEQMKMFLTRMGVGSKIVVTGDITQIDLPEGKISGLVQVQSLLKNVPGIAFSYLGKEDIVRHRLVQRIVEAYEQVHKTGQRKTSRR